MLARTLVALALFAACSGSKSAGDVPQPSSGSTVPRPPPPSSRYEHCTLGLGSCVEPDDACGYILPGAFESVCEPPCATDADCPLPSSILGETELLGVTCSTSGRCVPYRCAATERDNAKLVADGLICLRGTVQACSTLDPLLCACGCPAGSFCGEDQACAPKHDLGEDCRAADECTSGYCTSSSFDCVVATGSECMGGDTTCDCRAPAGGGVGYCLNDCNWTGDECVCPEGFERSDALCYTRCDADGDCRDFEYCKFKNPTDLAGYCAVVQTEP